MFFLGQKDLEALHEILAIEFDQARLKKVDEFVHNWYYNGYEKGYQDGRDDGYSCGYEVGFDEGSAEK